MRAKKEENDYKQVMEKHEDDCLEGFVHNSIDDDVYWVSVGPGEDVAEGVKPFGVDGMLGTGTGGG